MYELGGGMMVVMEKVRHSGSTQDAASDASGFRILGVHLTMRKLIIVIVLLAVLAFAAWQIFGGTALPKGIAGGNGRLEANELYVSTKYPGRVAEVLANEGDTVEAGQIVARMDTSALEAQLREAEAKLKEAADAARVTSAEVATKRALIQARGSDVSVKRSDYDFARLQYQRSRGLVPRGAVSEQEAQMDEARMRSTRAQIAGAQADLAGSRADYVGAVALAQRSTSTINAARAEVERLQAEIKDAVLVAPIRARVDTRLAEPGEVLSAGGRVFSLVDLSDVYMYVFLPERVTGKVALGSEARIVLDSAPQNPIRAVVSFVSPTAQFTPKSVETAEERHNLTFRVKLQIDKNRLREFESLVKVGVPGMGYVRTDSRVPWPEQLQVKAVTPAAFGLPTGSRKDK